MDSLYIISCFSLAVCRILPLFLAFNSSTLICFCIDHYRFISLAVTELLAYVDSHLLSSL